MMLLTFPYKKLKCATMSCYDYQNEGHALSFDNSSPRGDKQMVKLVVAIYICILTSEHTVIHTCNRCGK